MKEQIILIHGGGSFKDEKQALDFYKNKDIDEVRNNRSWKDWLTWTLEDSYEFIFPKMPTADYSHYEIWKIMFEKYLSKLNNKNLTIISQSLGTIFIIKYLVENGFPKKIKQLHLVSPIVSNNFQPVNDVGDTGSFTFDISKIKVIQKYCQAIHIWHSKDDICCDFKNAKYIKKEIPESILHTFSNKGHFLQSTFFELFDLLRK